MILVLGDLDRRSPIRASPRSRGSLTCEVRNWRVDDGKQHGAAQDSRFRIELLGSIACGSGPWATSTPWVVEPSDGPARREPT
jgi:hypothetical protein